MQVIWVICVSDSYLILHGVGCRIQWVSSWTLKQKLDKLWQEHGGNDGVVAYLK